MFTLLNSKERRARYRRIVSTWPTARLRRAIRTVHRDAKGIVWAEMISRRLR